MDVQQRPVDETLMVGYLLGQLSPSETESIEDRFLRDPQYFEECLAVEEELIDDYVRGALSDDQRQQFERYWLISSERHRRVAMAKSLLDIFRAQTRWNRFASALWTRFPIHGRRARLQLALAAAVLAVIVGALWLVPEAVRSKNELVALREERNGWQQAQRDLQRQLADERTRSDALEQQLRRESQLRVSSGEQAAPGSVHGLILAFTLSEGLTRSDPARNRLLVAAGAAAVRLEVVVSGDPEHSRYRLLLRTPEGNDVWTQDTLIDRTRPAEPRVFVTVPARVLPDGDYILTVRGFRPDGSAEDVTSRAFRIVRG